MLHCHYYDEQESKRASKALKQTERLERLRSSRPQTSSKLPGIVNDGDEIINTIPLINGTSIDGDATTTTSATSKPIDKSFANTNIVHANATLFGGGEDPTTPLDGTVPPALVLTTLADQPPDNTNIVHINATLSGGGANPTTPLDGTVPPALAITTLADQAPDNTIITGAIVETPTLHPEATGAFESSSSTAVLFPPHINSLLGEFQRLESMILQTLNQELQGPHHLFSGDSQHKNKYYNVCLE